MTHARNGTSNGSRPLESAVMPQQCREKGHAISTGEHVHGPRCPAVFWLGWQRGWQRSARSLVCTARRSFHSGCCSAPSPPGLPGRPCPRCCGNWLPLGGRKEGGNTDCSGRQAREFIEQDQNLALTVPVRRGLYRSPEAVLFQRWLNLARSSLSVVSSLSSIFKD